MTTEWTAEVRAALLELLPLCDASGGVGEAVRSGLTATVESAFAGEVVVPAALWSGVASGLRVCWEAAAAGSHQPRMLQGLGRLVALGYADPTRARQLDCAFCEPVFPSELMAAAAFPVSYVLDRGPVPPHIDPFHEEEAEPAPLADEEGDDEPFDEDELDPDEPTDDLPPPPLPSDAVAPPTPLPSAGGLVVTPEGGAPRSFYQYYRDRAMDAIDTVSLIARHRRERFLREAPDEEAWMLRLLDAVASTGITALPAMRRYLLEHLEDEPSDWWGPLFFLACVRGEVSRNLLAELLGLVPADAEAAVPWLASALVKGTSLELEPLLADLRESPHPVLRAAAVQVHCQRGQATGEQLLRWLMEPVPLVQRAALSGLRRAPGEPRTFPGIETLLPLLWQQGEPLLGLEAVRTSSWLLSGEGYRAWCRGELARLEGCQLELAMLFATERDVEQLDRLVAAEEPSPRLLSQLGRFGHLRYVSLLLESLGDESLVEAAGHALGTLFGHQEGYAERTDPAWWKGHLARFQGDPSLRWWLGKPFHPSTLQEEVSRGAASLVELELRLEELRCRYALPIPTHLDLWTSEALAVLAAGQCPLSSVRRDMTGRWADELAARV